ncbi:FxsA family protein [Pseudohoeflea coraliihabitans]|uniref:Membrane protein FxsA n=1 Tax=Pseudohoeflea coraliihabitans TaxID=2860393 RepID=A0ABS6WT44_9HYPH|nr:FxsA family protein [Pseudohoeflea sp. DP4N28-3]MBW3099131.1 membrane protein FxsA [Pseudohoeflea sp. DP4N28-3]
MRLSLLPLVLIVIPIAEIATFILIGGEIGVFSTLGLILLTALVGSFLLRQQGLGILNRVRSETEAGHVPGRDLVHGAMILVAGVLLLTPGFVTDTMGFLLFVPAVRDWAWGHLKSRVVVMATGRGSGSFGGAAPGGPGANHPRGSTKDGSYGGRGVDGPVVDLGSEDYTEGSKDADSPWFDEETSRKGGQKDGL